MTSSYSCADFPSYDERSELRDYLNRCKKLSPQDRLQRMGELRDFIMNHMTPEGRSFYEKFRNERLEGLL